MQKENGDNYPKMKELERCTDSRSGKDRRNGLEAVGNISLTEAPFSIRNDGTTSPGRDVSSNFRSPYENARVKPLYFQFLEARDHGQLPKGMTWDRYQKLHTSGEQKEK